MEKRIIIGSAAVIGIIIVIILLMGGHNNSISIAELNQTIQPTTTSNDQSDQVLGRLSHTITLEKTPTDRIEKVMVYKTVPLHYTRQDIISYGEKFNMNPDDDIKGGDEGYGRASKDRKIHLYITNTGWIEYTNSNRVDTVNPIDIPENLPTDEEAVKIATNFLKEQDLLPEGAYFGATRHGKIYQLGKDGDDAIIVWEDIEVWYGRKLNGMTVEGTQLMLAIGADGTPIEYFTNWRNYEPYKELPVKSPDQAFEELKEKGVSVDMNSKDALVSINDVSLAYHTKAGAYTEEYLEPVWVFEGNVMVDDKAVMEVQEFIPALKEEPAELISK